MPEANSPVFPKKFMYTQKFGKKYVSKPENQEGIHFFIHSSLPEDTIIIFARDVASYPTL